MNRNNYQSEREIRVLCELGELPYPLLHLFCKIGAKKIMTKQMMYPLCIFTKFTKYTSTPKWAKSAVAGNKNKQNWSRISGKIVKNSLFYELHALICTHYIPKGFFCYVEKIKSVNFVNLPFFEVHTSSQNLDNFGGLK